MVKTPSASPWTSIPSWLNDASPWSYVLICAALAAIVVVLVILGWMFRGRSASIELESRKTIKLGKRSVKEPKSSYDHLLVEDKGHETADINAPWQRFAVGIEHQELFAVEPVILQIIEHISTGTTPWALTVSGEGGIGKTAVTYEAVKQISRAHKFTRIIWASAKMQEFDGGDGGEDPTQLINWEDVLGEIGSQLGCEMGPRKLWEAQVAEHLSILDENERLLVVVDNLEGLHDAERLLDRIKRLGIDRPHRLIATTRWKIQKKNLGIPDIQLPSLGKVDTIKLVRSLGQHNRELQDASDRKLEPIYDISEGNPFLIKLIVRRYLQSTQSLDEIVNELARTQHRLPSTISLGSRVREWLYEQSLDELAYRTSEEIASNLMAAFCFFPRGASIPRDKLQRRSGISDNEEFLNAVEIAYDLALVRVSKEKRQYSIHSLLYEYTSVEFSDGR